MSLQKQFRRDTNANLTAATPAAGEPAFNTTSGRFHVGDGVTAGGIIVPNAADGQNQTLRHGGDVNASSNALTLVITPVPAAWVSGLKLKWKVITGANTGACTIGVTGLTGTKNLKKIVAGTITSLASADQAVGMEYEGVYNGSDVVITSVLNHGAPVTSVSQGNINSSTGSVSQAGTGSSFVTGVFTLPGGLYGFFPQVKESGAGGNSFVGIVGPALSSTGPTVAWGTPTITASYVSTITLGAKASGNTTFAQQLYVTSSPPFDLGDGELAGFIFAKVNKAADIIATYIADVPPWAYNGPTMIRADDVCPITGKKSRRVMKARSLDEIMDGAKVEFELQEIIQAIKNADMHLIPHPFHDLGDGESVVLLNPRDDRLADLMRYHAHGGSDDITAALHSGKIYVDNKALNMKGPPGVTIAPLGFKYSRK